MIKLCAGLGGVVVCFTRGQCRPRPFGRTIDDDEPDLVPAEWRFLSAIRVAGAGRGVRRAATIPDDRHPVAEGLVQAIVDLGGSLPLPHDDASHAYLTYRSVWGLAVVPRTVTVMSPILASRFG